MHLNRIKTDAERASYFEDYDDTEEMIYVYHFETIPQMRQLLTQRLKNTLSEKEILEAAKETFRSRPKKQLPGEDDKNKQVVDFIYQM